ncbi:hypothetical protein Anapl_10528 [Anas platyrhynchos]|uniref:Uncharacterized protein n=1 Tax=Anas platyrhynchos TaxID=8839 RepID=R0JJI7_ANAPL|nr:hypothetical protein Anapl_10528 [Anas platyrhynchos]
MAERPLVLALLYVRHMKYALRLPAAGGQRARNMLASGFWLRCDSTQCWVPPLVAGLVAFTCVPLHNGLCSAGNRNMTQEYPVVHTGPTAWLYYSSANAKDFSSVRNVPLFYIDEDIVVELAHLNTRLSLSMSEQYSVMITVLLVVTAHLTHLVHSATRAPQRCSEHGPSPEDGLALLGWSPPAARQRWGHLQPDCSKGTVSGGQNQTLQAIQPTNKRKFILSDTGPSPSKRDRRVAWFLVAACGARGFRSRGLSLMDISVLSCRVQPFFWGGPEENRAWPPLVPGGCLERRRSFWEGGTGDDGLCASSADNGKDISLHPFLGIAFRLTRNRLSLPVRRTRPHDSSIYSGTLRFASIFQTNHARRAQNLFAIVYDLQLAQVLLPQWLPSLCPANAWKRSLPSRMKDDYSHQLFCCRKLTVWGSRSVAREMLPSVKLMDSPGQQRGSQGMNFMSGVHMRQYFISRLGGEQGAEIRHLDGQQPSSADGAERKERTRARSIPASALVMLVVIPCCVTAETMVSLLWERKEKETRKNPRFNAELSRIRGAWRAARQAGRKSGGLAMETCLCFSGSSSKQIRFCETFCLRQISIR